MATNIRPLSTANVIIGGHRSAPSTITTTSGTGATWVSSTTAQMTAKGKFTIEGPNADLLINDKSMSEWMAQVEKRLTILSPKPELLEKYQALQTAYDHYKTLEALLYEAPDKDTK